MDNKKSNQNYTTLNFEEYGTDKATFVSKVFDSVAPNYDLMNDLMSFGIHRKWKNIFLNTLKPNKSMSLVDVGGGTGDVAYRFLKLGGYDVKIIDKNVEMLLSGKLREKKKNLDKKISWINGDAENLPLKSNSTDIYTTSFCIRNVSNIEAALIEAYRVLRPGGRFLCLEFSTVKLPVLAKLYKTYTFSMLPLLGQLVANDRTSYQYLVESIQAFPNQKEFSKLIENSGFSKVTFKNLSGGIVAIHSAWRI